MKIRHPMAVKVLGFAVACLLRVWFRLLGFRVRTPGPSVMPDQRGLRGRYLYTFWHENLLVPACQYGGPDVHVLISQHADGEVIAEACRSLGFRLVRGSSTRGGVEAVRTIVRMLRNGRMKHVAVTPDGPRGPRRQVQSGLIYLASRTGLPIVPMSFAYERAWRMNSWDRFVLPRPGSSVVMVTAEPIHVPEDLRKDLLEVYRARVEQALHAAEAAAERLVGTAAPQDSAARDAA